MIRNMGRERDGVRERRYTEEFLSKLQGITDFRNTSMEAPKAKALLPEKMCAMINFFGNSETQINLLCIRNN